MKPEHSHLKGLVDKAELYIELPKEFSVQDLLDLAEEAKEMGFTNIEIENGNLFFKR